MVEIVLYSLYNALFKWYFWFPSEFSAYLGRIDRIAEIMSFSVFYIGDILLSFAHFFQDEFGNFEITVFIIPSDIVDRGLPCSQKYFPYSIAVILDIEPVADIGPIAVEGDCLILTEEVDTVGDEFLTILVRTVVIRAAGDDIVEAIGATIGFHEEIASCLARTIGARGIDGRIFREKSSIREISIDFIGRNMMESLESKCSMGIEEILRTDDIGLREKSWIFYTIIHMTLCGEVDDIGREIFLVDFLYLGSVSDIRLFEKIVG
jgi:hypothetical protein